MTGGLSLGGSPKGLAWPAEPSEGTRLQSQCWSRSAGLQAYLRNLVLNQVPEFGSAAPCLDPRVRLNAWLARAGVASRRASDELIKAGRVTVNGEPGQLNTFVERRRRRARSTASRSRSSALAYVLLHKPAGVVTTARDPQGRPTVVEPRRAPGARRARRPPRRRHDRRAAADERRRARAPARAPSYEVDKVYVAEL